jgi:hypothetical protein
MSSCIVVPVMSTIGYGNRPTSWQGRTMVHTLGFLNVLLFGFISAAGGYVLNSVVNDFVSRRGFPAESRKWLASLLWAILLYFWMLIIALIYMHWKYHRLGQKVRLSDAFWFSYISTTTIGLGGPYLEPEVLVMADLITFPVIFLISFSIFGSFVEEVQAALYKPLEGRATLGDVLKEYGPLKKKGVLEQSIEFDISEKGLRVSGETNDELGAANVARTLATGR